VAIGVGILMICGEFDLSVGATFVLTPFVMAQVLLAGLPLPVAFLITFAVATMIGLSNGLITVVFRIPSFITTLGSMMFLRGVVRFVSDNKGVRFDLGEFAHSALTGSLGFAQMQVVWFILFAFAGYLIMVRHRLGNHIFMVGGNPKAAVAVGINANRVKVICFALSALCACFAGIMSAARVGAITPTGSVGIELQAIAICVVGGLSLRGGRGTVLGIALGAILFFTIQDVLLLIRAPGFYLDMFVGVIIIVAVILNQSNRGRV
jgi:simple sugar transport system permease protein